jgi:protease IV
MKSFFKYVFATIVGLSLFSLLTLLLFIGIVASLAPDKEKIEENSVLRLNLDKRIIERETGDLFTQFSRPFAASEPGTVGLLELRQAIKEAAKNDKIKGIYLYLNDVNAGFASLEELRAELENFKKSKKFIVAYSDSYSEGAYYLGSVADQIYLPPAGLLEFNGLNVELLFFKNLLDKLGIEPAVFKVGTFKSAVEPIISEKMSEANRLQTRELLNSIYGNILARVSSSRKIPVQELENISDSLLIRTAEDALKYKLITAIGYRNDVDNYLLKQLKIDKTSKINFVNPHDLITSDDFEELDEEGNGKDKIAVVYAVGDIIDGKGDDRTIGSETLCKDLREAREDSSVKAVVLRINSPGGSALASDVIWNEVLATSKVKPVIASMSDLAASGGYYIAAGCDTIVANPSTITGSIGVFGILFNSQKFLNDKLGITTDREQTGPYADLGSFTRPITAIERRIIQQEVENIYGRFLTVVAEGRKVDTAFVNQVGQGRVWSGTTAKDKKLVDLHAGLDKAIEIAAQRAKIKKYKIVYLPEQGNQFLKQLLNDMSDESADQYIRTHAGDYYPYIKSLQDLNKRQGVQTRIPFDFYIR